MARAVIFAAVLWITLAAAVRAEEMADGYRKEIEYWANGRYKSCSLFDISGRLKARAYCRPDGTVEKIEKFDIYGNRTQEALYDGKGGLRTGIDGWAAMRWWYDGSMLVSQISYGEDGRPIERRHFSDSGRLALRQYNEDEAINPYEEASMAVLPGTRNIGYKFDK